MTQKEQDILNKLYNLTNSVKEDNQEFKETIKKQINLIKKRVEQKQLPLNLETQVAQTINTELQIAIQKTLTDSYNSPLSKFINEVIGEYKEDIQNKVRQSFESELNNEKFDKILKQEMMFKIARNIIKGLDGSIDKVINNLKSDTVFRSEITLIVNKFTKNYIKND